MCRSDNNNNNNKQKQQQQKERKREKHEVTEISKSPGPNCTDKLNGGGHRYYHDS